MVLFSSIISFDKKFGTYILGKYNLNQGERNEPQHVQEGVKIRITEKKIIKVVVMAELVLISGLLQVLCYDF